LCFVFCFSSTFNCECILMLLTCLLSIFMRTPWPITMLIKFLPTCQYLLNYYMDCRLCIVCLFCFWIYWSFLVLNASWWYLLAYHPISCDLHWQLKCLSISYQLYNNNSILDLPTCTIPFYFCSLFCFFACFGLFIFRYFLYLLIMSWHRIFLASKYLDWVRLELDWVSLAWNLIGNKSSWRRIIWIEWDWN
jgi:hypothetical protein